MIVVDNASTDHTRAVLDAHPGVERLGLQRIHLDSNTGGSGGFRAGVAAAYDQGFDRIWLMDDDVVPAPDCLALLMAQDEACVMAVREDTHGRLVEKAAIDFDLSRPWSVRPKRASVETAYGDRQAMPRARGAAQRRLRGSAVPARGGRGGGAARRHVLHLLRRRRLRPARPSRRLPDLGGARRGAGAPAGLRPAARPRHAGRGTTCTATCSPCTSGTAPTRWCAPSPTRSRRRSSRSAPCAAGGRRRAT